MGRAQCGNRSIGNAVSQRSFCADETQSAARNSVVDRICRDEGCRRFARRSCHGYLLVALKDENPEARLAALQFLKFTPQDVVLKQMYEAMYKDDPELREAAYYVLWELGTAGVKLPHPSEYGLG